MPLRKTEKIGYLCLIVILTITIVGLANIMPPRENISPRPESSVTQMSD